MSGSLLVTNVTFVNNRALSGGAVVLTGASNVLIQNVSVAVAPDLTFGWLFVKHLSPIEVNGVGVI